MEKYVFVLWVICFGWLHLSWSIEEEISRIEYSFGENVDSLLLEGIDRFKVEYEDKNLVDGNFYLIIDYCERLDEINLMASYSICKSCDMFKLIDNTNRFYKLEEDRLLPIVFQFDLKHSNIFASADGSLRIKETRSDYMIELIPNLKKPGTYIINQRY